MKGNGAKYTLTNRQAAVIPHLLTCKSIEEACRKAKISKPTVYNWLKEESFNEELKTRRDQMYREALERLKGNVNKAVNKLLRLVDSRSEAIALRACNEIISHSLKITESVDLEKRLEQVENALEQLK